MEQHEIGADLLHDSHGRARQCVLDGVASGETVPYLKNLLRISRRVPFSLFRKACLCLLSLSLLSVLLPSISLQIASEDDPVLEHGMNMSSSAECPSETTSQMRFASGLLGVFQVSTAVAGEQRSPVRQNGASQDVYGTTGDGSEPLSDAYLRTETGSDGAHMEESRRTDDGRGTRMSREAEERLRTLLQQQVRREKRHAPVSLRERAVRETAKALGFQEGCQFQYARLLDQVRARRAEFSQIFDFRRLLIRDRVLPPVIYATGQSTALESDTCALEVEATYTIVEPARIVGSAPTWESYLEQEYTALEPSFIMEPKTRQERTLWEEAMREGFQAGIQHAYDVYELSFNKLVADYRGMLTFRRLEQEGYVSMPDLAEGDPVLQIGKDRLEVGQKVFRILVPATFIRKEKEKM